MDFIDTLKPYLSNEEISSLLDSLEKERVHGVFLNVDKISDEEFSALCPNAKKHPFLKHCYLYKKDEYDLGKSYLYEAGALSIQDPSSMMPAFFLNPPKGSLVLDMCASPGGKTVNLSFMVGREGLVLSNDLSYPRAQSLSNNIERMGLSNVIVTSGDYASFPFSTLFPYILLDAPCSGSAMFRKNELAKQDWTYKKVLFCKKEQTRLLEASYSLLMEGGYLLYSTCSFSYEENEEAILEFLSRHSDMEAISLPSSPLFFRSKALPEAIHFLPHIFEGEGQFACLLHKKGVLDMGNIKKQKLKPSILPGYSEFKHGDFTYAVPCMPLLPKGLSLLRAGIAIKEEGSYFPPLSYARHLDSDSSIKLTKEEASAYLQGLSFKKRGPYGFNAVSYNGLNLGYGKIVDGVLKNHYPKGLRKKVQFELGK